MASAVLLLDYLAVAKGQVLLVSIRVRPAVTSITTVAGARPVPQRVVPAGAEIIFVVIAPIYGVKVRVHSGLLILNLNLFELS